MAEQISHNEYPAYIWEREIKAATSPLFKQLKINYFGQTRVLNDGQVTALVTNPKLASYWYERQIPIPGTTSAGFILPQGYYLASLFESHLPDNTLLNLKNRFDTDNILFIVRKGDYYNDVYMLAAGAGSKFIINDYLNNAEFINKFLQSYEENTQTIILDSIAKTVDLPFQFERKLPYRSITEYETELLNNQSTVVHVQRKQKRHQMTTLTDREYECLELIAHGMSAKLVAKKLTISFRTVECHFQNIRQKLGSHSIKEAAAIYWAIE